MLNAEQRYEVIVVGGGVVGASAALAFAQQGLGVGWVASSVQTQTSRRMYSFNLASQAFLQELGVWRDVLAQRAAPYQSIMVWQNVPGQLCFDAKSLGQSCLGYMVDEADVITVLYQALWDHPNVQIWHDKVVSIALPGQVQLASGAHLQGELLVGADGAHSRLREWGGFVCKEQSYEQKAIVATIQHERQHQQQLYQRFLPGGPVALLAMLDPYQSSLVWTLSTKEAECMMVADEQDFNEALTEATQGVLGACSIAHHAGRSPVTARPPKHESIYWGHTLAKDDVDKPVPECFEHGKENSQVLSSSSRHAFPLICRHVHHYHHHNLVLVGDAAHTVHPLAGQGANLGLMDVQALVTAVVQARHRGWPLDDPATLNQWGRDRRADNVKMSGLFTVLNQLFAKEGQGMGVLRQLGMGLLQHLPWVKSAMVRRACGLTHLLF